MATYVGWFVRGFVIGVANIIPGVSGGTMALVLGIYERLIGAIHSITPQTFLVALKALTFKKDAIDAGFKELKRIDGYFLMVLCFGVLAAFGAFSKVIPLLILQLHDPTYAFFCGLILLSIITPLKMLKRFGVLEVVSLVVAIVMTVLLANQMIGQKALEKATQKLELKAAHEAAKAEKAAGTTAGVAVTATTDAAPALDAAPTAIAEAAPTVDAKPTVGLPKPDHSPAKLLWYFICGALAISAMILPGISGSFLMLLLGVYFDIWIAFHSLDVVTVGAFAAGCGIGLLVFTRLLNWLFAKYHDSTVAFLIGLMLGSMYGLWPFRESVPVGDKLVDLRLIMPAMDSNLAISVVAFLAGCAVILAFLKYEDMGTEAKAKAKAAVVGASADGAAH